LTRKLAELEGRMTPEQLERSDAKAQRLFDKYVGTSSRDGTHES
jgi:hypothetical protein